MGGGYGIILIISSSQGNTVITKLEEEVRSARSKSKLRKQAIQERDSRINQLNVSMETVKSEVGGWLSWDFYPGFYTMVQKDHE